MSCKRCETTKDRLTTTLKKLNNEQQELHSATQNIKRKMEKIKKESWHYRSLERDNKRRLQDYNNNTLTIQNIIEKLDTLND